MRRYVSHRQPTLDDCREAMVDRSNAMYPEAWDGLTAWWPMIAGGGSKVYDFSGDGNHGTMQNMDPSTDWIRGRNGRGGALDFDGSDDYAVTASRVTVPSKFSIGFWFRPYNDQGLNITERLFRLSYPTADYGFSIYKRNDNALQRFNNVFGATWDKGTTTNTSYHHLYLSGRANWIQNEWQHVCFVIRAYNDVTIYHNGTESPPDFTAYYAMPYGDALVSFGGRSTGLGLYGSMQDVRIYNRPLSDTEAMTSHSLGPLSHLLLRRRPTMVAFPSAVGVPYWLRQKTQIIGGGVI